MLGQTGREKVDQVKPLANDTASATDKIAILAEQDLFAAVPPAQLAQIAQRMRLKALQAGEVVFAKGDEGDSLLAVVDGLIRISAPSEDGREVVLSMIGPRQIFGEISLLDGYPRTADATAVVPTHVLVLGRSDFRQLLLREPALGIKLLEIIGGRLRRTSRQVEALSFRSPTARLAETLLRLGELPPGNPAAQPRISLTQREIGLAASLSRETTNKKLRGWIAQGILCVQKGQYVIAQPDTLEHIARDTEANDIS